MIDMQAPGTRKKVLIIAGVCLICLIAGMIYGCHREQKATQPKRVR